MATFKQCPTCKRFTLNTKTGLCENSSCKLIKFEDKNETRIQESDKVPSENKRGIKSFKQCPQCKRFSFNVQTNKCENMDCGFKVIEKREIESKKHVVNKYYKSGELMEVWSLKKGKPEGKSRAYYKSGKLLFESNYKNGILDGRQKAYHENGNLKSESEIKDGEPVNLKIYDQKENLIDDIVFGKRGSFVVVPSAKAEYGYISLKQCSCGGAYKVLGQSLTGPVDNPHDEIDVQCMSCKKPGTFLFDISSFYWK